ncbi:MAG: GIY-YIG nuclease family protein [Flavobacteriales bacterium]|nr:GIY-YIG nuclease family protein [Flavobacteriales bacterium]
MEEGIVYVLSNEAMPNLVKIGLTKRSEVTQRMSELYSTGVPIPFECCYACRVTDVSKVEKAIHLAFNPNRVNPSREFLNIEPYQAMSILEPVYNLTN